MAAPDVTITGGTVSIGVVSVGDLDGGGRDELATSLYDSVNAVSYINLRYGRPRPTAPLEAFVLEQDAANLAIDSHVLLGVSGAG